MVLWIFGSLEGHRATLLLRDHSQFRRLPPSAQRSSYISTHTPRMQLRALSILLFATAYLAGVAAKRASNGNEVENVSINCPPATINNWCRHTRSANVFLLPFDAGRIEAPYLFMRRILRVHKAKRSWKGLHSIT
jgi:hypothetical protein